MTTSPVMSVADELIAELKPCVSEDRSHNSAFRALVVERAELKRDAERYRWLREQSWTSKVCAVAEPSQSVKLGYDCPSCYRLDEAIDAAMQEQRQEN
jgi:hypothetical protein